MMYSVRVDDWRTESVIIASNKKTTVSRHVQYKDTKTTEIQQRVRFLQRL